ncbi:MAG: alpha/beta hydrolase [Eubacterium sp.]|nr:alpha/beta hydrolase [Eubacterium sp.]
MKLAVVFPGIGYHCDKPLLYYSSKMAKSLDYKICKVPFHDLSGKKDLIGNPKRMREVFEKARAQAEEMLSDIRWKQVEDILFLSKSVGTAVAASYAADHDLQVRHIYYTPVEETFRFMQEGSGIVFHGTADPWVETRIVQNGCREKMVPLYITEQANHSLETGVVLADLKNLQRIMEQTWSYMACEEAVYTIRKIEEADYGCEELPEGASVQAAVTLGDAQGREMTISAEDEDLYRKNLVPGDRVVVRAHALFRA